MSVGQRELFNTRPSRRGALAAFLAILLAAPSAARAASIKVAAQGGDLVLTCPGAFSLRFQKNRGGGITEYYDLKHDPGGQVNIAAKGGSLYDGLFFVMMKQESPEKWTASFQSTASVLKTIDTSPGTVKVQVKGSFPTGGFGLPASYDVVYVVTSSAKIYIRARVRFNKAYANAMQIRMALGLSAAFASSSGWVEFSQGSDLTPWYYHAGKHDDYIGARIEKSAVRVDPVLIAHKDWAISDYILSIAPPKADECLTAWVSKRSHTFTAGQTIENTYLLLMNQFGVTSHAGPAALAAAYRAGNGGDFGTNPGDPAVIVDNEDPAPLFTTKGSWPTNSTMPGYHGSSYALNAVGQGGDWARWRPALLTAGMYRVSASWSTDKDRPTDAVFTVHHAGGAKAVTVNMKSTSASGWNLLGEFAFAAGSAGYVVLTDAASNGAEVVADAIRFEPLDPPKGPDASVGKTDAAVSKEDGSSPVGVEGGTRVEGGSRSDGGQRSEEAGCGCSYPGGRGPDPLPLLLILIVVLDRRSRRVLL